MTEQCEHEWIWNDDLEIPFVCKEPDCRAFLVPEKTLPKLNATERLSAEDAKKEAMFINESINIVMEYVDDEPPYSEHIAEMMKRRDAQRDYADTLEGKDD